MKVAVALSGGVDSSVAAKILKDEGHDLVGLFLKLWSDPLCDVKRENRCCNYEALEDARKVAARLGIPFYVINARGEFKRGVVDYFLDEYKNLRTPNPCIVCNEKIKFDLLLKKVLAIGCDFLATGHYARIASANPKSEIRMSKQKKSNPKSKCRNREVLNLENSNFDIVSNFEFSASNFSLLKGIDPAKDQSYMLYRLNQDQLSKILFPLGGMKKSEVRKLATKWDLPVKEKPESQEICFFADKDYRAFLRRYLPARYFKPGEIVNCRGKVIGEHDGLLNYTIGQRKLVNQESGIVNQGDKKQLYVVKFDVGKNQLIVGEDRDVYKKEMIVGKLKWIKRKFSSSRELENTCRTRKIKVKIRYRHPEVTCRIASHPELAEGSSGVKVIFAKPQRAITPGQSAVFYCGDEVLGGGIIED